MSQMRCRPWASRPWAGGLCCSVAIERVAADLKPVGFCYRPLQLAAGIFDAHSRDFLEFPGEVVVVEDLDVELHVLVHDRGGAGRRYRQAVAVLFPGFNGAAPGLASDAAAVDDKTGTVEVRQFREHHLAALFGEDEVTQVALRGPGARKLEGARLCRRNEQGTCQQKARKVDSTETKHRFLLG